jgi:hypothetical protein
MAVCVLATSYVSLSKIVRRRENQPILNHKMDMDSPLS